MLVVCLPSRSRGEVQQDAAAYSRRWDVSTGCSGAEYFVSRAKVSSHLPSPLQWDEERSWNFDIDIEAPVLFLIRDHINMLTDLGKDWASGPPNDFDTFIPMNYGVTITLTDYELNLYANDHNIIDRPLDTKDNGTTRKLYLFPCRNTDFCNSYFHAGGHLSR